MKREFPFMRNPPFDHFPAPPSGAVLPPHAHPPNTADHHRSGHESACRGPDGHFNPSVEALCTKVRWVSMKRTTNGEIMRALAAMSRFQGVLPDWDW